MERDNYQFWARIRKRLLRDQKIILNMCTLPSSCQSQISGRQSRPGDQTFPALLEIFKIEPD